MTFEDFLTEFSGQGTGYMTPRPIMPAAIGMPASGEGYVPPQLEQFVPAGDALPFSMNGNAPPAPANAPNAGMESAPREAAPPPSMRDLGMPRQLGRKQYGDLFNPYAATVNAGRQMFAPPDPNAPPVEQAPRYLSHTGQTAPGGMTPGQSYGGGQDAQGSEMARRFPRAHALQQRLSQMQAMQSMQPQMEAQMAREKADTELSLMKQKGALEQEAMRRKFDNTEAQMGQQMRKSQLQQVQRRMNPPQPQSVRPPR